MNLKKSKNILNLTLNNNFGIKTECIPKVVCIETTNYCNLKCSMCNYRFMSRQKEHMTFKLFKKIIDEIRHYPFVSGIDIQMWGEPFLNKDIFKMVDYSVDKVPIVRLNTNGMLLNDKNTKRLMATPIKHFTISIDATTKETYDKIRCGGDFDTVIKNTKKFLKAKGKGNRPYTVVQIIEMKHNKSELDAFKEQWKDLADEVDIVRLSSFSNPNTNYDDNKIQDYDHDSVPFCGILWNRMCIYSNGDVPFCYADYDGKNLLGNVYESKIIDIWNSDKIFRLRNNFRRNKNLPKECRYCNEYDRNGDYSIRRILRDFVDKISGREKISKNHR